MLSGGLLNVQGPVPGLPVEIGGLDSLDRVNSGREFVSLALVKLCLWPALSELDDFIRFQVVLTNQSAIDQRPVPAPEVSEDVPPVLE